MHQILSSKLVSGVFSSVCLFVFNHNYRPYLDHKIEIQEDKVHQQADIIAEHLKHMAVELRRLILVENMCDSVKVEMLFRKSDFFFFSNGYSGFSVFLLCELN